MTIYDHTVRTLDGKTTSLKPYQGKALLIVNVASACGFTPQYTGLQKLYEKYKGKGFEVLGFPCNQFGAQEPGSAEEIRDFCDTRYHVTFPLFEKIDVNGPKADPLYDYLKKEEPGILGSEAIKWNFTKFLVSPQGKVIKRYAPQSTPESLDKDVAAALPKA